ncbi:MAG: 3-isopropylmalate dehydratase small subunit [Pseudomonadota bacterium]
MTGINEIKGRLAPLDQANVDTDQIIPKQFLTGITRKGYGKHLFHDWRYLDTNESVLNPDFSLNKEEYQGANILLTRQNFGCGSSREHAPWSLGDYGFDAIIASSYADIFYSNCINNQILPVKLSEEDIENIFQRLYANAQLQVSISLPDQTVVVDGAVFSFDIEAQHKHNLLKGLDAIGQTLELDEKIAVFEKNRAAWL